MKTFKEYAVNEGRYKKVDIDLGGPYNISKLGYDANGNWSYMVSKGSGKPKKIQHQGEWDSKLVKGDSAEGSKIAKQITDYYDEFINEASLNSASQKKIDKLYASYKEQVKKSKGNLETLHYKIKTNFVNNEYTRASNQEIDYIWSLYKKETDKTLNEKMSMKDEILGGITFEDLMDTVESNEKDINEKTIKKVYNEILKMKLDDATYVLNKNIKELLKW